VTNGVSGTNVILMNGMDVETNAVVATSTGFTAGGTANANGVTFEYVAFWNTDNNWLVAESYTGAQTNVVTGRQPIWVHTGEDQGGDYGGIHQDDAAGDHFHYTNKMGSWMQAGFDFTSNGFNPNHFQKSGDTHQYIAPLW
jgi:hypothetical protein